MPGRNRFKPDSQGQKPSTEPQKYGRWPREMPPIPECIQNDDVSWVAAFVNEKLSRFNQVEKRQEDAKKHKQEWKESTTKKWETRIWREILPCVLLGLRYLWNTIKHESKVLHLVDVKQQFDDATHELREFYIKLRNDKDAKYILKPYKWYQDLAGRDTCPWTELRVVIAFSLITKLDDKYRRKQPRKYLAYVREAEQEWLMVKKFVMLEKNRGNTKLLREVDSNESAIQKKLDFLAQEKIELGMELLTVD